MINSVVFISHIVEEKEIAYRIKQIIEEKFLNLVKVFVSSDEECIRLGDEWIKNIKDNLKECQILVVLCSPTSISRPWVNFEAGAGWIREIPVIPLCHSGLLPSDLPSQLRSLQGGILNSKATIDGLFRVIACVNKISAPSISDGEFNELFKDIKFETNTTGVVFIGATGFVVNGVAKVANVPPIIVNGHPLVSVRMACEILGAEVGWNDDTKTITLRTSRTTLDLKIGTKLIILNNQSYYADIPPVIISGLTYLPILSIFKICGIKYEEAYTKDGVLDAISFESSRL